MVLKRLHRTIWAVGWYVTGEAAATVVEQYDDTSDAVVFPLASLALLSGLVYALATFTPSSATDLVFFSIMVLLAASLAERTVVSVWATAIYFTERTAEPMLSEVSR